MISVMLGRELEKILVNILNQCNALLHRSYLARSYNFLVVGKRGLRCSWRCSKAMCRNPANVFCPTIRPNCSIGLRFMAVLVMCCTIFVHVSSMHETQERLGHKTQGDLEEQNSASGLSADGAKTGAKQSLLQRQRRSVKNIVTPNLPDIGKRLKDMEESHNKSIRLMGKRLQELKERLDALLRITPRSSDSWLLAYLVGRHGRNGLMGPPGPPGKIGKSGPVGKPGPSGKTGPEGKIGPPGKSGPAGKTGLPGKPGTVGITGPTGKTGPKGEPGTNKPYPGPRGPKGDQGAAGKAGAQGPQGFKGEKGQEGTGKAGVKYVRWGRTTCPKGAQIVYKGLIGGEQYNHPGGGVNYLCLPKTPKYDKYNDGWNYAGRVCGAEYKINGFNPFKQNLDNHDAPCVVCFAKSRGSMLMMPARNDCPSGWTEEYHGYLMTEYYGHKKARDYICVDVDPEYAPGSRGGSNRALLYHVEGQCGSLPCLPYVNGRELTCAVCTK